MAEKVTHMYDAMSNPTVLLCGKDITTVDDASAFLGNTTCEYCISAFMERAAEKEHDPVNHPSHYNAHPSGIECIDIVRHMSFNLGNVVKYLWRAGIKDADAELEDLKKAAFYLNDEIKMREGNA